jgi:hypothetical protein
MPITGRAFTVTDFAGFVSSYLLRPDSPDPATFKPLAGARVTARLTSLTVGASVLPPATTAADGRFTIATPANSGNLRVRVLIEQPSAQSSGTLVSVFRSENRVLGEVLGKDLELYVMPTTIDARITQPELNAQLADLKAQLGVQELTGVISDGGIQLDAKQGPAKVSAFIRLLPSTSANLDEIITARIENLDVNVAFPCSLFVNEDEIKQQVRQGVRDAFAKVNEDIKTNFVNTVATQQDLPPAIVESIVDQLVTVTISRLTFPFATSGRVIKAQPTIGVPRKLLTPTGILTPPP